MTQVAIGNQTVETQAEVGENWGTSALIEDAIRHREGPVSYTHLTLPTSDLV